MLNAGGIAMAEGSGSTFSSATDWGPALVAEGVRFRIWAPDAKTVELSCGGEKLEPLIREADGWWSLTTRSVDVGGGYGFRFDGGPVVPDPAARAQVGDVHGLSKLVDPHAYSWKTADWKGRPWHECVFYELHTGTFSPEGTFEGVEKKLDHLVDAGITAIELLPVAQFGGERG